MLGPTVGQDTYRSGRNPLVSMSELWGRLELRGKLEGKLNAVGKKKRAWEASPQMTSGTPREKIDHQPNAVLG